jgi:ankyrin repeat protein
VVRVLIEKGADASKENNRGETPLHVAAEDGNEAIARALTNAGADVNKTTGSAYGDVTPLYVAAANGHEAIVRALIKADADVNTASKGDWE